MSLVGQAVFAACFRPQALLRWGQRTRTARRRQCTRRCPGTAYGRPSCAGALTRFAPIARRAAASARAQRTAPGKADPGGGMGGHRGHEIG